MVSSRLSLPDHWRSVLPTANYLVPHGLVAELQRADSDLPTTNLMRSVADLSPLVVTLVLQIPQGVVEIEGTLIESAASRGDTHICTGQTRVFLIALLPTVDATRPY
jgi:hypothetical protein